jgi:gentisate 1,2-dioxygenase
MSAEQDQAFLDKMEAVDSYPLWLAHANRTPGPQVVPHVWRWETMKELAYEAGALESLQGAGVRRALLLRNPGLKASGATGSTKTISAAVQIVWPGEIAEAHRHTATAIRWVIDGDGAFTVQDGERFRMTEGDLTLTPNWSWHDHNNPTDKPVIWLDCLDAPMIGYYDAMFQEPYPEDVQPVTKPVGYTNASIGNGLMRGIVQDGVRALPLTYKWDEAYHSLLGLDTASRFDGVIMEYANPLTGGHTLPTMALKLQRLRAGEHTDAHRHTSCAIYNVGKGKGYTIIDGKRLDWSQGDTFVLPSMAVHEHGNSADDDDAVLFSMSDLPMIETIGCYREEECDRQEVVGAIG